ncbi:variant surface glycoprotein (VSG), putative [Trypanosoma equiperdum]|uniref:Variant surface glycoprotein (VSG), putative n=1 Tax=Trypanosoma equiperdum TaxID=5694 RepID=A0A1G4IFY2_TRYEQ|nr:variant surface glycoprotein (VSG), putative [Trypanosoma equiperdum]
MTQSSRPSLTTPRYSQITANGAAVLYWFFVCFLETASLKALAAAHAGLSNTAWEPICDIITELGKVTSGVRYEADQMTTHIRQMQKAAARTAIYAAKRHDSPLVTAALALEAYYSLQATKSTADYATSAIANHLETAVAAAYLKGRIDDFFNLLDEVKGGTNNKCLLQAQNSDTAAQRTGTKLGSTECDFGAPAVASTPYTQDKLSKDGFKGLKHGEGSGRNDISPSVGTAKCKILQFHNTAGWAATATESQKPTAMAGYLKLDTADNKATFASATDLTSGSDPKTVAWRTALNKINTMKRAAAGGYKNETGKPSSRAVLQTIVTTRLPADDIGNAEKVEGEFKRIFQEDVETKIKEAEEDISRDKIPAKTAGLTGDKMLGEIEDIEQLEKLQYYYDVELLKTMQSLKKQLEEAQKPKQQQPTADKDKVCTEAGDDKDKCDKLEKQGCVFNQTGETNKKCKFDAKKTAEQATQETGTGAGEQTSKCTGLDSKDKCEAVQGTAPPGKKSVCGWITYEDGKGTLDKPYCRDSSFLVNKQLALMVSAAFVALLF